MRRASRKWRCFPDSVCPRGTAVHPAGGFGATRKCSRTSKGTSGGQREAGIICGQFPAPTRPVRGRALRVPGSETGPGGVTSLPQASPAHPRPGQGAGSLNAFTAPRKLRWGRLGPRRGPPPLHPMHVVPGAGLRRPPGLARAAQSQRRGEAGAARMNSFFPPLGSDRKTRTLSKWPQVRTLPVSPDRSQALRDADLVSTQRPRLWVPVAQLPLRSAPFSSSLLDYWGWPGSRAPGSRGKTERKCSRGDPSKLLPQRSSPRRGPGCPNGAQHPVPTMGSSYFQPL